MNTPPSLWVKTMLIPNTSLWNIRKVSSMVKSIYLLSNRAEIESSSTARSFLDSIWKGFLENQSEQAKRCNTEGIIFECFLLKYSLYYRKFKYVGGTLDCKCLHKSLPSNSHAHCGHQNTATLFAFYSDKALVFPRECLNWVCFAVSLSLPSSILGHSLHSSTPVACSPHHRPKHRLFLKSWSILKK